MEIHDIIEKEKGGVNMKWKSQLAIGTVCGVLLCILLERADWVWFFCGFAAGVLSSLPMRKMEKQAGNMAGLIYYIPTVFWKMTVSAVQMTRTIWSGQEIEYETVTCPADRRLSENGHALVANAITLTPGTVTLEENEKGFTVLCIKGERKEDPAHAFEKALLKKWRER